ncbi:hypothetical protein CsatB_006116 [Cannabis sativa]
MMLMVAAVWDKVVEPGGCYIARVNQNREKMSSNCHIYRYIDCWQKVSFLKESIC